jgi:hypothetical protein
VTLLNEKIEGGTFKRVYASGSVGTYCDVPELTGDVRGTVDNFPQKLKIECKVGYSNKLVGDTKSISVRKEWLDKIIEEASKDYSMPVLICKFDGVRAGVKHFAALDLDTFASMINEITALRKELDLVYQEKADVGSDKTNL